MEEGKVKNFMCRFCYKTFPSGKSLGGHIRIHMNENSVDSNRHNENKKRLVDQKEKQQQQQVCCRKCGKGFVSLKALSFHMTSHSEREKMSMDRQSDTETSSAPTRNRAKRVMRIFNSESCSNGSLSFASETDQETGEAAYTLVLLSGDSSFKKRRDLVMNSHCEASNNDSVTVETKSSVREELKILNVKNKDLETAKVVDYDQLRSVADNVVMFYDSDCSDSDYFMNGPKNLDSDISVEGSLRNTEFGSRFNKSLNTFKNSYERRSKSELSKSKSKIRRYKDNKSQMVTKAGDEKKRSKGHQCPNCFKIFKSGQALGGHKKSHSIGNLQHNQVSEMRNQFDLDVSVSDIEE